MKSGQVTDILREMADKLEDPKRGLQAGDLLRLMELNAYLFGTYCKTAEQRIAKAQAMRRSVNAVFAEMSEMN